MGLLRVCLPRRGCSLKKMLLGCLAMFISCWITVLVIQNSSETSLSSSKKMPEQKLPFMHVSEHNQAPKEIPREPSRDSINTHRKNKQKNETVKENLVHQESKGKNIPRMLLNANVPGKSLLSTVDHVVSNKSKSIIRTKPSPFEVVARLNSLPSMKGPSSLELLQQRLVSLNQQEKILNSDRFPPLASDDIVLIVQVHKRLGYLKQLLESLRAARDIDKVLLVVSHDYYYDEMNQLVETVEFCKVCTCTDSVARVIESLVYTTSVSV